jgi:ABC-type sugar transport system ATPase subunit
MAMSCIGIRPEHIELIDGDASALEALVGRIEKCIFLGSFTRITLAIGDQRLVLELRGRRTDLTPGNMLAVRIPGHAIHRLQDAVP